jgi:hypothetical protein
MPLCVILTCSLTHRLSKVSIDDVLDDTSLSIPAPHVRKDFSALESNPHVASSMSLVYRGFHVI